MLLGRLDNEMKAFYFWQLGSECLNHRTLFKNVLAGRRVQTFPHQSSNTTQPITGHFQGSLMPEKKTRARHEKSATGCKTCRIRRVKCDETRPECQKCTSTGRRCDGPTTTPYQFIVDSSGQSPVRQSLIISAVPDQYLRNPKLQEKRAFQYYLQRVAPGLSGSLDAEFWSVLIPRIARSNHVLWNAIIAISCFWESPRPSGDASPGPQQSFTARQLQALTYYTRALSQQRLHSAQPAPVEPVLVCVMFGSIEFQQHNYAIATRLLYTGFSLLAPSLTTCLSRTSLCAGRPFEVENLLVPMCMRNACLLSTAGLCSLSRLEKVESLEESRTELFRLMMATYGLLKDTIFDLRGQRTSSSSPHACAVRLGQVFDSWLSTLNRFLDERPSHLSHPVANSVDFLQILLAYQEVTQTWLSLILDFTAGDIPRETDMFHRVLDRAAAVTRSSGRLFAHTSMPSFFFEMVILPPLYLVVMLCSESPLREQAYAMIAQNTSQKRRGQLYGMFLCKEEGEEKDEEGGGGGGGGGEEPFLSKSTSKSISVKILRVDHDDEGERMIIDRTVKVDFQAM